MSRNCIDFVLKLKFFNNVVLSGTLRFIGIHRSCTDDWNGAKGSSAFTLTIGLSGMARSLTLMGNI